MTGGAGSSTFVNMVMLIDDNETDNFIHRRIIEITGFAARIEVKSMVKTALDYLKANKNIPQNFPDIIFLDLNLPHLNGFDFLEEYATLPAEIRSKCKVVVLTSSDSEKDVSAIKNNPSVARYFTKPLSEEILNILRGN